MTVAFPIEEDPVCASTMSIASIAESFVKAGKQWARAKEDQDEFVIM